MWITVFLVFLTVIFSCNTQEVTNFDVQTVTDTTQSNQGVKWDSTGPSVTLSIRDGRSNSANKPPDERPNHPLPIYSNEWRPYLMPIGFNNFGYANGPLEEGGEDSVNYPFAPTVLRRSNSDLNGTSSRQLENGSGFGNSFSPVPVPITPFPQMYFYPPQLSQFWNGNADAAGNSNLLQNSTAPTARSTFSDADTSSLREVQKDIVASPYFSMLPDIPDRYPPINFYRNGNGFIPPPAFAPPYPILPNTNENYLHPLAYPYISHLYGRETGSEGIESNIERQNVPEAETVATSGDVQEHDRDVVNGTPSDSSSTFLPPEQYPLPLGAFPFGVLPPPILPPLLPNPAAAAGLPIRPLIENVNLPKEGLVADVIASQSPISTNLALESPTRSLPPVNTLLTDAEISAGIAANAEESITEEQPNQAKIPYEFGFDMNDGKGTDQHRKEVSDVTGTVRGSYGYRDVFGVYRLVNYIADKNGFRAVIKSNEPGVASSGSANVVVMAEQPPPHAIAEGQKIEPEAIIVPDASTDLIAEGSAITAK